MSRDRSPVVSLGIFSVTSDNPMCPVSTQYQDTPGGKDGRCVRLTTNQLQVPMSRFTARRLSKSFGVKGLICTPWYRRPKNLEVGVTCSRSCMLCLIWTWLLLLAPLFYWTVSKRSYSVTPWWSLQGFYSVRVTVNSGPDTQQNDWPGSKRSLADSPVHLGYSFLNRQSEGTSDSGLALWQVSRALCSRITVGLWKGYACEMWVRDRV
jgi:hypothetical protein